MEPRFFDMISAALFALIVVGVPAWALGAIFGDGVVLDVFASAAFAVVWVAMWARLAQRPPPPPGPPPTRYGIW